MLFKCFVFSENVLKLILFENLLKKFICVKIWIDYFIIYLSLMNFIGV